MQCSPVQLGGLINRLQATESAHKFEKLYEKMVETEKVAAHAQTKATAKVDVAKQALAGYDLTASNEFATKQKEVQLRLYICVQLNYKITIVVQVSVGVDAAEERSKAASKVDSDALRAADDAMLIKQQAEAEVIQAKDQAKAARLVAVAQKDSSEQELATSRDAIVQQEAHVAAFKDNSVSINADFVRKVR